MYYFDAFESRQQSLIGPLAGGFTVTTPGVYRVKGWFYIPDSASNSFFVTVDGSPVEGAIWDVEVNTSFAEDYVNYRNMADPWEISLGAGQHSLVFYGWEDGTRLDKFQVELVSAEATSTPTPTATATATTTPTPTPTATATGTCGGLEQEAEAGTLS